MSGANHEPSTMRRLVFASWDTGEMQSVPDAPGMAYPRSMRAWEPYLVALLTIAAVAQTLRPHATPFNNYVLLADALLHGHVWIDWPGTQIDAVTFGGKYYIVNDPVPALLMLPLVEMFGTRASQALPAVVLCGVAAGAAWRLCARLGLSLASRIWLLAFLLLGTDLWWCTSLADVWFFAQTSAVAFTLLCLAELAGGRRAWIVGLTFALAAGSRFTLIMALPVIAGLLATGGISAEEPERRPAVDRKRLLEFAAALLPFAALWVAYNEVRWGLPWDSGHTIFYHEDQLAGSPYGSPFGIEHVPYQLFSFFVQWPRWIPYYPYVYPTVKGVALTWTSPALLLAFFAAS